MSDERKTTGCSVLLFSHAACASLQVSLILCRQKKGADLLSCVLNVEVTRVTTRARSDLGFGKEKARPEERRDFDYYFCPLFKLYIYSLCEHVAVSCCVASSVKQE
jgi:hypothetical protein